MPAVDAQLTKYKSLKLKRTRFYAIPLMAFAGLAMLGIFAINQDVDPSASAANNTALTDTISYDDEYITISNSVVVDLGTQSVTADSSYAYATDNVTVSTNVSTGYELYLSSANKASADLTSDNNYNTPISATSGSGGELGTPTVLDQDSYGYAVPSAQIGNNKFDVSYASPGSSSKFAGVPAGSSDRIRSTGTAVASGETTEVHYGVNVTNALAPGTYTGSVTYSAVVTPTEGNYEMSVSPNETFANTDTATVSTTLTVTSGPTTINTAANLNVDEVEVYLRQNGVTNGACNVTNVNVSSGHVVTTCTTPALSVGNYDILIIIPRYGFKDMQTNIYSVISPTTIPLENNMQDSSIAAICAGLTEVKSSMDYKTYELTDARNSQKYYIRKFTFNNTPYCMMVENLYLTGGTKLTSNDTNISNNYTLPSSSNSGFGSHNNGAHYMYNGGDSVSDTRYRYIGSGNKDGSYYNQRAATAEFGGDICPKYWRLPTWEESGHIATRLNSIGVNSFFADSNGFSKSPTMSGFCNGTCSVGGYIWWWSSTNSRNLIYDSSSHFSTGNPWIDYGASVRCLVQATDG